MFFLQAKYYFKAQRRLLSPYVIVGFCTFRFYCNLTVEWASQKSMEAFLYKVRGFLWFSFSKTFSNFSHLGFLVGVFIPHDLSVWCGRVGVCVHIFVYTLGVRAPSVSCPLTGAILPVFTHLPPPPLPTLPSNSPLQSRGPVLGSHPDHTLNCHLLCAESPPAVPPPPSSDPKPTPPPHATPAHQPLAYF